MSDTTITEPQALPGDGLREGIVDELRRHIGDALVDSVLRPNDDLWVRIATDAWRRAGEALESMGFDYFCFLSAIDWMPSPYGRGEDDPTEPPPQRSTEVRQGVAGGDTRFQVIARVTDTRRHVGVHLKVDVPDDTMTVESWFTVYAGANWHERETHEMFGIAFAGHPDLRNMYLPTEFEGYPLRKDFPLLARMVKPWPGIVDVEPMPPEETIAAEAGEIANVPTDSDAVEEARELEATTDDTALPADAGEAVAASAPARSEHDAGTDEGSANDESEATERVSNERAHSAQPLTDPTPQDPPPVEEPPADATPQDPPPAEEPPSDPTPQDPPPVDDPPTDPTPQDQP